MCDGCILNIKWVICEMKENLKENSICFKWSVPQKKMGIKSSEKDLHKTDISTEEVKYQLFK